MAYLIIFIGGGIGSILRFMTSSFITSKAGYGFPFGTLIVNLIGAFLIGLIIELTALRFSESANLRFFLVTGFLGGFTTFSAFSLESSLMWIKGEYFPLAIYISASVIGTIIMVLLATYLVRSVI